MANVASFQALSAVIPYAFGAKMGSAASLLCIILGNGIESTQFIGRWVVTSAPTPSHNPR